MVKFRKLFRTEQIRATPTLAEVYRGEVLGADTTTTHSQVQQTHDLNIGAPTPIFPLATSEVPECKGEGASDPNFIPANLGNDF